jgi:hypothetical protein
VPDIPSTEVVGQRSAVFAPSWLSKPQPPQNVFFTQKEPEVPLKEESEQVIETEEDIVTEEEAPP